MAPKEPTYKLNPYGEKRRLYSLSAELLFSEKTKQPVALLVDNLSKKQWELTILDSKEEKVFPNRLQAIGYLERSLEE